MHARSEKEKRTSPKPRSTYTATPFFVDDVCPPAKRAMGADAEFMLHSAYAGELSFNIHHLIEQQFPWPDFPSVQLSYYRGAVSVTAREMLRMLQLHIMHWGTFSAIRGILAAAREDFDDGPQLRGLEALNALWELDALLPEVEQMMAPWRSGASSMVRIEPDGAPEQQQLQPPPSQPLPSSPVQPQLQQLTARKRRVPMPDGTPMGIAAASISDSSV